jgi:hypothetical protein
MGTSDPNAQMYAAGLFSTPVYDSEQNIQGCIAYPSSVELGPSIKTARAFAILLLAFEVLIFLGLALVHFFVEYGAKTIYHIVRVLLPSAFCCQLLTFAAFASKFCSEILDPLDEEGGTMPATCVPGGAGVVGIFNLVAIILMTTLMNMISPPENPVFQLYGTGNSDVRINNQRQRTPKTVSEPKKPPKKHHKPKRQKEVESYSIREPQRPGRETVKTTIVNGPGVRKTIKEITHPDGSQTITTTIEELQTSFDDFDDEDELTYEDDDSALLDVL